MNQTEFSLHMKTWKAGILKHIRAVTFVKLEYQSNARVCELLRSPRICAARSCVWGGWRIFKSRIPSQSEFGAYLRLLTSKGIKVLRWAYGELGFRPISRLYQIPSALHLGLRYRMRDGPSNVKVVDWYCYKLSCTPIHWSCNGGTPLPTMFPAIIHPPATRLLDPVKTAHKRPLKNLPKVIWLALVTREPEKLPGKKRCLFCF